MHEEVCKADLVEAVNSRYCYLLATTRSQKTGKRMEDVEAGKYRVAVEDVATRGDELERAHNRQEQVVSLLDEIKIHAPHLAPELDRILCHVSFP
jgi:hypothetical protein